MKTLVIYGTRRGSTARSAELIAETLRGAKVDAKAIDARRARRRILDEADSFVLGSSIAMGRWKGSARRLLPRLAACGKPTAVFVTAAGTLSGMKPGEESRGTVTTVAPAGVSEAISKYIDPVVTEAGLHPVAVAAFGGRMAMFGREFVNNWDGQSVASWAAGLPRVLGA
jgi:menaquinone-dependent protoporphyrinogen IX oxidase